MDEDGEGVHAPLDDPTLASEASLAIVAGSDTTSMALANALFYLISHPASMARLRAELDGAAPPGEDVAPGALGGLPYLQAVLSETLRLQPAVPNGVQRTPPPEGGSVIVAGHVVPVGTAIQIPTWSSTSFFNLGLPALTKREQFTTIRVTSRPTRTSSGRSAGCRTRVPNSPHRVAPPNSYSTRPRTCRSATVGHSSPFFRLHLTRAGPTNCVGRALAQHEMRTILTALVRRFDMHFAPGFSPADWEAQLRDAYVLVRGKLPVVVGLRA
jgi:cytochrome P450